ncbi:hypothetical protein [Rickettsia endosymbiont of Orchestes rusci]|uniref:hypothetical protein n=1 Tax=Rickettsia endosymbiont of Orchestes rusci TaxID=3066250 RepID=UPI00313E4639
MKTLQGFRTIIFNSVALLTAWLARFDIDIPEDHQTAMGITLISIINIILRLLTKTPIGKKEALEPLKNKVIKNN